MIDTSVVLLHQHGACVADNNQQDMGRSRGGLISPGAPHSFPGHHTIGKWPSSWLQCAPIANNSEPTNSGNTSSSATWPTRRPSTRSESATPFVSYPGRWASLVPGPLWSLSVIGQLRREIPGEAAGRRGSGPSMRLVTISVSSFCTPRVVIQWCEAPNEDAYAALPRSPPVCDERLFGKMRKAGRQKNNLPAKIAWAMTRKPKANKSFFRCLSAST
jgi:hypothetical protein